MAARAIGSGTIAFGMVAIPVKLYTAASDADSIRFNQLHAECKSRVKQRLHCPTCDVAVERNELVKGYEFAKGKFVTFTKEELDVIAAQSSESIEIHEFVPLADVDPIYFEKAYYLGPEKGAARPYILLAEAMRRTGLSAVASYASRGKDYLTLLRPVEDGIILQQLRHGTEVRQFSDVPLPDDQNINEAELDLAIRLIEQISASTFKSDKYKDEVRARVEALINQKVEGEEISAAAPQAPKAQVIDLMSALKASLEGSDAEAEEASPAPKKKAAAKRKGPKRVAKKKTARKGRASEG